MTCLDENDALDFVHGRLAPEAALAVERHVDACADCFALLSHLARLATADTSERVLAPPPSSAGDLSSERVRRGTTIGRYVVLDFVGSGAMGTVYAAYDPDLDRKIALKLVRAERGPEREVRAQRLAKEARAMARLSHPNVVSVYDVGAVGDQVFVAMEFIDGQTLGAWLREGAAGAPIGWRPVVDVFRQAGRGLAAAHDAGIVHRDFKPENVLVSASGRVVVTDFGIARARTAPTETARARAPSPLDATAKSAALGTPAYMAPEQFRGEASAQSDQFGFCVALHEALYGRRPFTGATFAELETAIAQGRVPPADRGAAVPAWLRQIVLRGLRTAPEERFASMAELLDALARKPRRLVRARLAALGALAVAGVSATAYLRAGGRERRLCEQAENDAASIWAEPHKKSVRDALLGTQRPYAADAWRGVERTLDAYLRDWRSAHAPTCASPGEATRARARCLSDRGEELRVLVNVLEHADPEVTKNAFGAARSLTPVERCTDPERASREVARRGRAREVWSKLVEAKVLGDAGSFPAGRALAAEATAAAEALHDPSARGEALFLRGDLELGSGDPNGAARTLHRAIYAADAAKDDATRVRALAELLYVDGYVLRVEAPVEDLNAQALAALERIGGDDELESLRAYCHGMTLRASGRLLDARGELEKALALREKVFGPESREAAQALNGLGALMHAQGRYDASLAYFERVLAMWEKDLGPEHPEVAVALNNIGAVMYEAGRVAEAIAFFARALRVYEDALGPDHPSVGSTAGNLGEVQVGLGHYAEAVPLLARAVTIRERSFGPDSPKLASHLATLGKAYAGAGDDAKAIATLERAVRLAGEGGDRGARFEGLFFLGKTLWDSGRDRARARTLVERARAAVTHLAEPTAADDANAKTAQQWLDAHPR